MSASPSFPDATTRLHRRGWLQAVGAALAPVPGKAWAQQAAGTAPAAAAEPAASRRTAEGERLLAFLRDADDEDLRLNPQAAVLRGDLRWAHAFGDLISDAYFALAESQLRSQLARFAGIDRQRLDPIERVAYDAWAWQARWSLRPFDEGHLAIARQLPIDHLQGQHLLFAQFSSGRGGAPYRTREDYDAGLARIDGFALYLDRVVDRLREGVRARRTWPRAVTRQLIAQLDQALTLTPQASPFYGPIRAMSAEIAAADRPRLARAYRDAITRTIRPAFARLRHFLRHTYLAASRTGAPGLAAMPGGRDYYAHQLEGHTTLRLDADAIHRAGLGEVARLEAQMRELQARIGFAGTLAAFYKHLETDARYKFATPEALLDAYRAIGQRVDRELAKHFDRRPKARLDIAAVPREQEGSAGGAYYLIGTPDGTRPGTFYVNTSALPTRTSPRMTALYLHEGLPGHHLQGSLAQEDEQLPPTLRFGWNAGYGEGWALYAETLGQEMGLYDDPIQHVGQIDMALFRAARLVVDTGLHAYGWSHRQAVDYLLAHTSLDHGFCAREVDRYVVWPGQACAYALGEMTLRRLRADAERALGPRFSTRAFHHEVLATGAIPLQVLEAEVRAWMVTNATTTKEKPMASGRAGDFDFLQGRWTIKNRRLKQRWTNDPQWEEFDGASTCWTVLGGLGSIEELRIPADKPLGLGIRLLDTKTGLWSDYWISATSGEVAGPPATGTFENGAGTFTATGDQDGDIPIHSRGVWDQITPTSCRWHQAFSRDGGKTWEPNWTMTWTRVG